MPLLHLLAVSLQAWTWKAETTPTRCLLPQISSDYVIYARWLKFNDLFKRGFVVRALFKIKIFFIFVLFILDHIDESSLQPQLSLETRAGKQGLNLKPGFASNKRCFSSQHVFSIKVPDMLLQLLFVPQIVHCVLCSPKQFQSISVLLSFFTSPDRILPSQWDVRALEAGPGLTEGAWWNTNPSRSMSASCVCHVSLGSMVAAGNAINAPMMTLPRWEEEITTFCGWSKPITSAFFWLLVI